MKTFIISDHHFGHANILKFKNDEGGLIRPQFSCVQEMNEYMIEMWNSVVTDDDKVYHLGDFQMSASTNRFIELISKLKGRKELILGNHDEVNINVLKEHFKKVRASKILKIADKKVLLTHVPAHPASVFNGYNLHGHTHQRIIPDKRYINVCVEHWDYTPIDINIIGKIIKEREECNCNYQYNIDSFGNVRYKLVI